MFIPILKQVVRGCASGKGAELLMQCVLVEARKGKAGKEDTINLAATNGVMSIRSRIVAKVETEGTVALPGSRLLEVLSALRGMDDVTFESGDVSFVPGVEVRNVIAVSSGAQARVEFPLQNPAGFPAIHIASKDGVALAKIKAEDFGAAMRMVKHASLPEVTSNFHGVFCGYTGSGTGCTATLSKASSAMVPIAWPTCANGQQLIPACGVLLPIAVVETILGLCDIAPELDIGVKCREDGAPIRVYIRDRSSEIAVQLPENQFPPEIVTQIIKCSKGWSSESVKDESGEMVEKEVSRPWLWLRIPREDFSDALRLFTTMLSGSKSPTAVCKITKGANSCMLVMRSDGAEGAVNQQIAAKAVLYTPGKFASEPGMSLDYIGDWVFESDVDESGAKIAGTEGRTEFGVNVGLMSSHINQLAQNCDEIEIGVTNLPGQMQFIRPVVVAGAPTYLGMSTPMTP